MHIPDSYLAENALLLQFYVQQNSGDFQGNFPAKLAFPDDSGDTVVENLGDGEYSFTRIHDNAPENAQRVALHTPGFLS